MSQDQRDLACVEVWEHSMARSRARRRGYGGPWWSTGRWSCRASATWRRRAVAALAGRSVARRHAAPASLRPRPHPGGQALARDPRDPGGGSAARVAAAAGGGGGRRGGPTATTAVSPGARGSHRGHRPARAGHRARTGSTARRPTAAIRSFQSAHGLVVDGIVGPQTTAALMGAGASGSGTSALQRALGHRRGRRVRPPDRVRGAQLPVRARPGGGRRRRSRHLGGARAERLHRRLKQTVGDGARHPRRLEQRLLGSLVVLERHSDVVSRVIAAGNRDRRPALPLRRRPRLVHRQRLRLLGLGVLRAARRRAAARR